MMDRNQWRQLERLCDIIDHAAQQAEIPPLPREQGETHLYQLVAHADAHDIANVRSLLWLAGRHVDGISLYVEGEAGNPERGRICGVRHATDQDHDSAIMLITQPYTKTIVTPKNVWVQLGEIMKAAIIIEGHRTPTSRPVYMITTPATRLGQHRGERLRLTDLVYHLETINQMEFEEPTEEYVLRTVNR